MTQAAKILIVDDTAEVVGAIERLLSRRGYHVVGLSDSRQAIDVFSFEEAAAEVRRCSGHHFDPDLIEPALTYLADHLPHDLDPVVKRTASME